MPEVPAHANPKVGDDDPAAPSWDLGNRPGLPHCNFKQLSSRSDAKCLLEFAGDERRLDGESEYRHRLGQYEGL